MFWFYHGEGFGFMTEQYVLLIYKGWHYSDVIMGMMASKISGLTIVYSTVYSGTDHRKNQSSTSLAFVWGIHRVPVNSPYKWPVTWKMFQFDDVIMEAVFVNTWLLLRYACYIINHLNKLMAILIFHLILIIVYEVFMSPPMYCVFTGMTKVGYWFQCTHPLWDAWVNNLNTPHYLSQQRHACPPKIVAIDMMQNKC